MASRLGGPCATAECNGDDFETIKPEFRGTSRCGSKVDLGSELGKVAYPVLCDWGTSVGYKKQAHEVNIPEVVHGSKP